MLHGPAFRCYAYQCLKTTAGAGCACLIKYVIFPSDVQNLTVFGVLWDNVCCESHPARGLQKQRLNTCVVWSKCIFFT